MKNLWSMFSGLFIISLVFGVGWLSGLYFNIFFKIIVILLGFFFVFSFFMGNAWGGSKEFTLIFLIFGIFLLLGLFISWGINEHFEINMILKLFIPD